MSEGHTYLAIDLKSFYASVECVERGLDPLTTNLVVADTSRTEKTICLAVSPSLKSYGIKGRARLFEVIQTLKSLNNKRQFNAPKYKFTGKSTNYDELKKHPELSIDYIAAPPRMKLYIDYSTRIYNIYLHYVSHEDIHVYSIDEVFIDIGNYVKTYKTSVRELTMRILNDVLKETGITGTAGIGSNLYLAKVAMDIVAKHIPADANGVRIAELDERSYREKLWSHRPLTDFWRIGKGIAQKLERNEIYTMGMLARYSIENEEKLYKLFGVNAELIIDHAWGWEPCTIEAIKKYCPKKNSLSCGQVLPSPYPVKKARLVTLEMSDNIALTLVERRLVTDQMTLTINYDSESMANILKKGVHIDEIVYDHYDRMVPKPAHGSVNLPFPTSSARIINEAITQLFDRIVNPDLLVRNIVIGSNNIVSEKQSETNCQQKDIQLDLFSDIDNNEKKKNQSNESLAKERKIQETLIGIKKKYGRNSILKGMNYKDGATAKERNGQIGGHKA